MPGKTFNCEMDITFHHTPDGRPELYDFLWEHVSRLAAALNEKKVLLKVSPAQPVEKWSKLSGMEKVEIEHIIKKFQHDQRIKVNEEKLSSGEELALNISAEELDHVLNSYNIFLERFLPYLSLEGKNMRIDFSPAEKNSVKCFAFSEQKPLINTFLVRNLKQAPRVRSIIFASAHERMEKRGDVARVR